MVYILIATLAMAAKDVLGTLLVIAEARGRAVLAGLLDVVGDLAALFSYGFGAEAIITHGFSTYTFVFLFALSIASFHSTMFATYLGRKMKGVEAEKV